MRQVQFLTGLFRSGNTVLSAILNQHPEVYVSSLSPLSSLLWSLHAEASDNQTFVRSEEHYARYLRIQSAMASTMYADVEKPLVIDRGKDWGHPENINLAIKYITPRPKIVTTVRTVIDTIASYVAIAEEQVYQDAVLKSGMFGVHYKPRMDVICDNLMHPNGTFERSLFSVANSLNDPRVDVHLVEYDNLLTDPHQVLSDIHEFLEIQPFEHDFNNIQKREVDRDDKVTITSSNIPHSADLHKVRPVLARSEVRAEDVLPASVIQKYSNMEFWRK